MASLLRCPTYSCHHRPSSFPTRGGLHCQAHQLDTKAKVCPKSPQLLRKNPLLSGKSPPVFSASFGLWEHNGRRLGKSSPRGRECATNKAAHSMVSPTAVGVFLLIAPLSVAKEGRCFCPSPAAGCKMAVGAKEKARAGESVDEAVRKHGRKGMGTRAQKSAGRRELNVCRREEEAL